MGWTKDQKWAYERTIEAFKRNAPHLSDSRIIEIMDALHRNNTTLNRINEIHCDVEMTERQTKELEKKEAAAERRVMALIEELGFKVHIKGDPRGQAIKIKLPDRNLNDEFTLNW